MISANVETLRDFYTHVYSPLKLRGKSISTKQQYLIQLKHLHRFMGRDAKLADLDDELITSFLGWIVDQGKSPATANKARNHILALWRFAARKRLVESFPDVPAEREPERTPQAWNAADLHKLFISCQQEPGHLAGVPACKWWSALHHVLWDSGERIGAVLRLKWQHVDLDSGWLIIPAELRKGKRQDKSFRLHADTVAALRLIREPARPIIFEWPKNVLLIYRDYRRILERAGLPTDRRSKFHRMRRSTASHFEAAGGNATELLGHTSRRTTMAYLDPRVIQPQQASEILFRPNQGQQQPLF
jgi:integrase